MHSALSTVLNLASALLILYLVAIMVRITATWFNAPGRSLGWLAFLAKATDPYLNLFRRIRFLQLRGFDLSPLLAIAVLYALINIVGQLIVSQGIWFGRVLSIFILVLGTGVAYIFLLFALLALVRLVAVLARASSVNQVWYMLDHLLQPLVYPLISRISPRRVIPYGTGLGIFAAANLLVYWLANLLVYFLAGLADNIPF